MARKETPILTDAELRIMNVVWESGDLSVSDITDKLEKEGTQLAYNTVLSMMRILERKGYVTHHKVSRNFLYNPVVPKEEAQQQALDQLKDNYYEGSTNNLILNILEKEQLNTEQLQKLKSMIDQFDSQN